MLTVDMLYLMFEMLLVLLKADFFECTSNNQKLFKRLRAKFEDVLYKPLPFCEWK